jgi:ubiquinone/menaquinone biosynthesis C-methylase UbiE
MNQKQLWEKLAQENSRYYINSDFGRKITEDEFRQSGKEDFIKYIFDDPLFKSGTIVEIGCGTGRMTEFMGWEFDKVYGLDISGEMIRQARERVQSEKIEFIETDGEMIPLTPYSVDYVFSYLVFQHMKTREMVEKNFAEAYRILKPDGIFKVRLRTDEIKDLDSWWAGVSYNEQSIRDLCGRIGFTVIKLQYVKEYGVWVWMKK